MKSELNKPLWIAAPLMILWLAAMLYAFWWFQVRELRSFDADTGQARMPFDAQRMITVLKRMNTGAVTAESVQPVVLHFWNPDCNCNRFNTPHVRRIIEAYAQHGVRFVTVATAAPGRNRQALLTEARKLFGVAAVMAEDLDVDLSGTATSPAAAVINGGGELAYYGPYSDSAFCGSSGAAFVEKALDRILAGQAARLQKPLAFGCFCEWQSTGLTKRFYLPENRDQT